VSAFLPGIREIYFFALAGFEATVRTAVWPAMVASFCAASTTCFAAFLAAS
jgi:hypothetical protein